MCGGLWHDLCCNNRPYGTGHELCPPCCDASASAPPRERRSSLQIARRGVRASCQRLLQGRSRWPPKKKNVSAITMTIQPVMINRYVNVPCQGKGSRDVPLETRVCCQAAREGPRRKGRGEHWARGGARSRLPWRDSCLSTGERGKGVSVLQDSRGAIAAAESTAELELAPHGRCGPVVFDT